MSHLNDGVGMDKRIHCVETVKARAQEQADHLRAMGWEARVHARQIRAERCTTIGYVVISNYGVPGAVAKGRP